MGDSEKGASRWAGTRLVNITGTAPSSPPPPPYGCLLYSYEFSYCGEKGKHEYYFDYEL